MQKPSILAAARRVCLTVLVVAFGLCGPDISGSHAQTNSPAVEAALAPLRQEARTKASAAQATASRLSPAQHDDAQQLFSTAFTLAQQQDYESAKVAFQRGLAIDPSNGQAEYYLAEVLVQLNDPAGAMPHYALAQALTPNSPEGIKAEVAMTKEQASLSVPLQVGQVWNLSWSRYVGTLTVVQQVNDASFRGSIQLTQGTHEDANISISGTTMTINCSNASGSYHPDNFQLSKSGPDQWTGTNRDNAGSFSTGVMLTKG